MSEPLKSVAVGVRFTIENHDRLEQARGLNLSPSKAVNEMLELFWSDYMKIKATELRKALVAIEKN